LESTPTRSVLSWVATCLGSPLVRLLEPGIVADLHIMQKVKAVVQGLKPEHSRIGLYL
jgi:glucose-6-phosphate dehydrogenase assembly protein OpcA